MNRIHERKRQFEKNGFVCIESFCDTEQLLELEAALSRFIQVVVPTLPPEEVFYEDKSHKATLKQIQRMHQHDEFFGDFMQHKPKQLAEELLGEDVRPKNLQFFNKPPGKSMATPAHQDGRYFMLDPCNAVTMWMALDLVDEGNGCVRYLRGSHLDGLRPHGRTGTLGFSQGITDFGENETRDEVPCPAQPGDLLAHHALTIHRADANLSENRSRRALGFIFYGKSAKEDGKAHEAYQRQLAEEMTAKGKI